MNKGEIFFSKNILKYQETIQALSHTIYCKQIFGGFNMSDLAATNCGGCGCGDNNGGNCIWLILILLFCCGNGCGRGDNGCGCDWIWIILLICCCGNGNGCGNNNFLGCGC